MVRRVRFTAEAFEKYLDGLNEKFDTTILWNTLQGKSEYGTDQSEKGYQKVAAVKASMMARKLGLNEERASFYTKCLGAAFPAFGKEGRKRVEEYAVAYDLPYDEKETMASVIEESLSQSGRFVVEGLREVLLELFDETKDSSIKEIELAKLCHEQMEILKNLDRTSRDKFNEGEKRLDEEIEKNIKKLGIAGCKHQLIGLKKSMKATPAAMTMEEIENYYSLIDSYNDFSGDECLINFVLHAVNPA